MQPFLSDDLFRQFSSLIARRCGIGLQKALLESRLKQRLRATGFSNCIRYYHHILSPGGEEELNRLVDCVVTGHTHFFREQQHFDFLDETVIPELMERKKSSFSNRIRIWCAGCSSGEEPYSLAMLFLQRLGDLSRWDLRVLATDISRRLLNAARRGMYPREKVARVPPDLKKAYFQSRTGSGGETLYEVVHALRRVVVFKYLNLKEAGGSFDGPFEGSFDLVFCRNVMIYFDGATQRVLVHQIASRLAPGGHLFVGHAESLAGVEHPLRYVLPSIYRKP